MAILLLRLAAFLLFSGAIVLVSGSNAAMTPAMVWSNTRCSFGQQRRVDYQVLSPQAMAAAVYAEFRSNREQCRDESVDIFVEFVGNELRSSDLARDIPSVNVLKEIFAASGGSLSLPYIANKDDGSFLANVLLDEISPEAPSAVYGCPGASNSMKDLQSVEDVEDYIKSRRPGAGAAYLVVCSSPSTVGTSQSEGEALRNILSVVEDAGIGYMALYASDPYVARNRRWVTSRRLAANDTSAASSNTSVSGSSSSSNSSGNATAPYCDDVCRTKATLLEAIFVTIVLLVILISGLCCMMGIQTPIRFEKPHET